jgi:hypothetical protein
MRIMIGLIMSIKLVIRLIIAPINLQIFLREILFLKTQWSWQQKIAKMGGSVMWKMREPFAAHLHIHWCEEN